MGRSQAWNDRFSHKITGPDGPVAARLPGGLRLDEKRYTYRVVDINDTDALRSLFEDSKPAQILHLASGLRGDSEPELRRKNVSGMTSLLAAIAAVRDFSPTLLFASSGGVYGQAESGALPLREDHPRLPLDNYSTTKLEAERLATDFASRHGGRLVIARIFNILGAGQDERHVAGRIALQLAEIRRNGGKSIELGALDTTRDFVDVRDVAAALVFLADRAGATETYNVGSGVECSIAELLRTFLESASMKVVVRHRAEVRAEIVRHYADITRLRAAGFHPAFSLRDSVDWIWDYYQRLWLQ